MTPSEEGIGIMYKKQMALQRVFCILAIAASALVFVYALGYMTDVFDMIYMLRESYKTEEINRFLTEMDLFNRELVRVGIGLILLSLTLLLTNTHTRRKYYAGNYIAVGLNAAAEVAATVLMHGKIAAFKAQYLTEGFIDFEVVKNWADRNSRNGGISVYTESTFWFDAHYFVFGILLLAAVLLIWNAIWKTTLMKREREALAVGKAVSQ